MLPYRSAPGIPCVRFAPRPLRSAKGTGLSEPRITRMAQTHPGHSLRVRFACSLPLGCAKRTRAVDRAWLGGGRGLRLVVVGVSRGSSRR